MIRYEILGKFYQATDDKKFAVGDMVYDRQDGCCGVIDMIIGDEAAVCSGGAAELGVALTRLAKLKLIN